MCRKVLIYRFLLNHRKLVLTVNLSVKEVIFLYVAVQVYAYLFVSTCRCLYVDGLSQCHYICVILKYTRTHTHTSMYYCIYVYMCICVYIRVYVCRYKPLYEISTDGVNE